MKQLIFFLLFLSVIAETFGGEGVSDCFKNSRGFDSFKQCYKNDSVLSFRSKKGYVPALIHNLGFQATFPLRLKGRQFTYLGGTALITFGLLQVDQKLDDKIRPLKNSNSFIKTVSPEITELGDYYGYMALAGYGCYTIIFHKYRGFRTALLASQAAISAGIWIRVGKVMTGRMRPEATYTDREFNSDHWFGPFAQFDKRFNNRGVAAFDAFPSGHTGAAFAMATVFSEEYKDQIAIPITMYSLAGIVAITRLIEHTHWASDVFLGGVVGYLCGKQVIANEKRNFPQYKTANRKNNFNYFYPVAFENGKYGAGWRLVF